MDFAQQDRQLLLLSSRGQPELFGLIVERYQQQIRSSLFRWTRGDRALVDDLAQECFLKAFQKAEAFRGEGSLAGWLLRIAHTEFLQHLRRNKGDAPLDFDLLDEGQVDPARQVEFASALDYGLAQLPLRQRQAIDLCLGNGFTYDEAAEIMGVPAGTVKSDVSRGREALKTILG